MNVQAMASPEQHHPPAVPGIELAAGTLEELFAAATVALCGQITDAGDVMPREGRIVDLAADDPEGLLAAWLRELVNVFESEGMLFCLARVELLRLAGHATLKARLWGEPFDPDRHFLRGPVGRVDPDALRLHRNGDGLWHARLVVER